MKRKLVSLMLAVAICVNLCGCICLFSDSYHYETEFSGGAPLQFDPEVEVVQNYAELRRVVFAMVNSHEESVELMFSGYAGNAMSDIASVCNAVKTESAYGAYCVNYVAYDLTQIVSTYRATITISYLYSNEELEGLATVSNHESFTALMLQALEQEESKLVVKINNGTSDVAQVESLIQDSMRNNPLSISYYPKATVKIYSGNSSQKVYEVNVTYDDTIDNESRLTETHSAVQKLLYPIGRENLGRTIVGAATALSNLCVISDFGGDTAYDALCLAQANSEGVACAFKAICDVLEIECLVVVGKMGKNEHYWNIVKVDSDYYHVDVSMLEKLGGERALFLRDADKQVDCWWNQAEYPDCEGALTYEAVFLP